MSIPAYQIAGTGADVHIGCIRRTAPRRSVVDSRIRQLADVKPRLYPTSLNRHPKAAMSVSMASPRRRARLSTTCAAASVEFPGTSTAGVSALGRTWQAYLGEAARRSLRVVRVSEAASTPVWCLLLARCRRWRGLGYMLSMASWTQPWPFG